MIKSRNEKILENMLGADNELEEPISRNETLLQQILNKELEGKSLIAETDGNGTVTLKVR